MEETVVMKLSTYNAMLEEKKVIVEQCKNLYKENVEFLEMIGKFKNRMIRSELHYHKAISCSKEDFLSEDSLYCGHETLFKDYGITMQEAFDVMAEYWEEQNAE